MVNEDTFVDFRGEIAPPLDPPLVLRELYCSVVTKWVLSKTANLSAFKLVIVLILTCGHES